MYLENKSEFAQITKRLLFVGHGGMGSNALSLYKGFCEEVKEVFFIDTQQFDSPPRFSMRNVAKHISPTLYGISASWYLRKRIMYLINSCDPQMVFVFKGNFVSRQILQRISVPKIHYHPDDSTNQDNRTKIFNLAESSYDLHFTAKSHNLKEIAARTGKPVHFIWYAYDPDWHFKAVGFNFANRKFKLGLIGNYRISRAKLISNLALRYQKNFAIAGVRWTRVKGLRKSVELLGPIYGPSFSNFIAHAPVQLGILNSENRDQHTARTFEIPASGGLLLAEDTPEHRFLFEKARGALFFKSEEELVALIDWVEKKPREAEVIARNGHLLITGQRNTWRDRAISILEICNQQFSK